MARTVPPVDPESPLLETDYRDKTTDIAALRGAMSVDDRKRLDGHGDFPVDPVTVRREVPQLTKASFEAQVTNR